MKKITSLLLAALMLVGTMALGVSAASASSDAVILFEDFEYDPASYVMGENFCYGAGDQASAPTGTVANRGYYWIGNRRTNPDMLSYAEIKTGAGKDGTSALAIASSITHAENSQSDIQVFSKNVYDLTDYNYLIVWCDFSDVEFRGASFSFITEDGIYGGTDERDGSFDSFYYLGDDTDEWEEYVFGSDNAFGSAQESPVNGMKGYFAFDLSTFKVRTAIHTTGASGVTGEMPRHNVVGVSMWFDHPNDQAGEYDNVPFYFDNILFTKEMSVANIPVPADEPEETAAPETAAPETAAPETAAPETAAPETAAPETAAPETAAPETAAPETAAPETTAPEVVTPAETAPQTFDAGIIAAAAAVVSAAGYAISKKRR